MEARSLLVAMFGLVLLAEAALAGGCGTSQLVDGGGDAMGDCTPFGFIPKTTEFFYDASEESDGEAGCVGDPGLYLGFVDAGTQIYPLGTQAVLPTVSGSDVNCQGPPLGSYCLCGPLRCYCQSSMAPKWYCPN